MLALADTGQTLMPLAWGSQWGIIIVLIVILLLFGGKKLPELARGLGRGLRIFRTELRGIASETDDAAKDETANTPKAVDSKPAETKPADSKPQDKQPPQTQG